MRLVREVVQVSAQSGFLSPRDPSRPLSKAGGIEKCHHQLDLPACRERARDRARETEKAIAACTVALAGLAGKPPSQSLLTTSAGKRTKGTACSQQGAFEHPGQLGGWVFVPFFAELRRRRQGGPHGAPRVTRQPSQPAGPPYTHVARIGVQWKGAI